MCKAVLVYCEPCPIKYFIISVIARPIILFSVLLILASQRIEDIVGWDLPSDTTKRGSLPSVVEYGVLAWVAGNINSNMLTDSHGMGN